MIDPLERVKKLAEFELALPSPMERGPVFRRRESSPSSAEDAGDMMVLLLLLLLLYIDDDVTADTDLDDELFPNSELTL